MENFEELALSWDNEPRRIERAKIVANDILNIIPIDNSMSALEYGCGTGLLSFNLQPYLKDITLADSSDGMLSVLQQKISKFKVSNMKPLKLDLTEDKLPDGQFDLIYTLLTLHHIIEVDTVLKAFYGILSSSGCLCIADLDEEDGSFHGADFEGHNGFNRLKLANKLEKLGFSLISNKVCFEAVKTNAEGQEKRYPVFLMIVRKP